MTNPTTAIERIVAAGIRRPYVPASFRQQIDDIGDWVASSRREPPPLELFDRRVEEIVASPPEAYVEFGHAGHGIASWAFHYYLVTPYAAIFDQAAWGGADTSSEIDVDYVNARLAAAEALAVNLERTATDDRIVVASSDFGSARWGRAAAALDNLEDVDWQREANGLDALVHAYLSSAA